MPTGVEMTDVSLFVVQHDEEAFQALAGALDQAGSRHPRVRARDGREALDLLRAGRVPAPFVLVLDLDLPEPGGAAFLAEVRADEVHGGCFVLALAGAEAQAAAIRDLDRPIAGCGAQECLPKAGWTVVLIDQAVRNAVARMELRRHLGEARQALERMAMYDPLTGLGNRRLFRLDLDRALAVAQRREAGFHVLVMALEGLAGLPAEAAEAVLAEFGQRLRTHGRASDPFFRLDGSRFAGILDPGSEVGAARRRLAAALDAPFSAAGSAAVQVRLVQAGYPEDGHLGEQILAAAEARLDPA